MSPDPKNTPYFLKQVVQARAWELDTWKLPYRLDVAGVDPEDYGFTVGTRLGSRPNAR